MSMKNRRDDFRGGGDARRGGGYRDSGPRGGYDRYDDRDYRGGAPPSRDYERRGGGGYRDEPPRYEDRGGYRGDSRGPPPGDYDRRGPPPGD